MATNNSVTNKTERIRAPSPAKAKAIAERKQCVSTCRATHATTLKEYREAMQVTMKKRREDAMNKRKEEAMKNKEAMLKKRAEAAKERAAKLEQLKDKPELLKKFEADRAAKKAKNMEEMRKKRAAAKAAREAKKMPAPTKTA